MARITRLSGVTLGVSSMRKSFPFYRDVLGLRPICGGEEANFSSFDVGGGYLNLERSTQVSPDWGRVILHCDDVDAMHRRTRARGMAAPEPQDAPWGERYFHLRDPDGHEISLAQPIGRR